MEKLSKYYGILDCKKWYENTQELITEANKWLFSESLKSNLIKKIQSNWPDIVDKEYERKRAI